MLKEHACFKSKIFVLFHINSKSIWKWLSHVWLFVTLWTMASQIPLSMGFLRQEYWNRLPFPSPSYLPNAGIEPRSPASEADSLPSELSRKLNYSLKWLMLNLVLLPKENAWFKSKFFVVFHVNSKCLYLIPDKNTFTYM